MRLPNPSTMPVTESKPVLTEHALVLPWDAASSDPAALRSREWLVTNGFGGYASGTLEGLPTRRFHGLLIASLPAPKGRTMLLPYLEEQCSLPGGTVSLGALQFAGGASEGQGGSLLKEFRWEWHRPTWRFEVDGRQLQKSLVMPNGQNTVCVRYTLLTGAPLQLILRPFITFRPHHLLSPAVDPLILTVVEHRYEVRCGGESPVLKFRFTPNPSSVTIQDQVKPSVFYHMEYARGYDHLETLHSPGSFVLDPAVDHPVTAVISSEPWELLGWESSSPFDAERQRCERLLKIAVKRAQTGACAQLALAADQFLTWPGSRVEESAAARASGDEARTVIAGYHWFTDWTRDTMISLEGLTLLTGRYQEARSILRTFSHYLKDGLLPNHVPEGKRTAVYHAADATLWYFHALDRYDAITHDRQTLRLLYPILASVITHYVQGTHFGIGVDPRDGLVRADAAGYPLTWMDAKADGSVLTPRAGKPVEIQALWYNALQLMAQWAEELHEPSATFATMAERSRASFNTRFWSETGRHLLDVVDGRGGDDASFRPNPLFAISLRFPILSTSRWKPVIDRVAHRDAPLRRCHGMPSAGCGRATAARFRSAPRACAAAAICTSRAGAARMPASTSSRRMMGSR